MPQFPPSVSKTGGAPITVSPSGLSCTAELYLVSGATKVATSGLKAFTSTGVAQTISFPITMPSTTGAYKVYLDVYAEGMLIAAYIATEDVTVVVAVAPCPCVYCGATFSTEAGLISHMEANHPGKPYLVHAVPQGSGASGGSLSIVCKVYTPTVPAGDAYYLFTFYIPDFPVWEPYNGAYVTLNGGTPAGFYEEAGGMVLRYQVYQHTFANIPPGTYRLFSKCREYRADGALLRTFWEGQDSGRTITVS